MASVLLAITLLIITYPCPILGLEVDCDCTTTLVGNILQTWKLFESSCTLRFISFKTAQSHNKNDNAGFDLNWNLTASLGQPQQNILIVPGLPIKSSNDSKIFLKFKSYCVSVTMIFPPNNVNYFLYFDEIGKFGNGLHDQFIWLVNTKDHAGLGDAATRSRLINLTKYKYFMVCNSQPGFNNSITYLVEPAEHTGKFAKVSDPNSIISALKSQKVNNLAGQTLTSTFAYIPPYSIITRSGSFAGSHFSLFLEISLRSNFTPNIVFYPNDKSLGSLLENGTWTGITGKMTSGLVEIGIAMGVNYPKDEVIDFAQESGREAMVFCLTEPKHFLSWEALFRPLSFKVWICSGLIFAIISALMYIYEKKAKLIHEKDGTLHERLENFCETIMVPLGMFLEQPLPTAISQSFLGVIWLLGCIVLGTSYKCNLAGFLTLPAKDSFPKTFKELCERPDYTINIYFISGVDKAMWSSPPSTVMKGIAKRFHVLPDLESCLKLAQHPKTACSHWKTIMKTVIYKYLPIKRNSEPLYITHEAADSVTAGIGFRKGSIFIDRFDKFSGYAVAGNLVKRWIEEFIQNVRRSQLAKAKRADLNGTKAAVMDYDDDGSGTAKPLTIGNVLEIFFILFIGSAAAFVGYLGELVMFQVSGEKMQRMNGKVVAINVK